MRQFHLSMHAEYETQNLSVHTDFKEGDIFNIVQRMETFLKGCGYDIYSLQLHMDDPMAYENEMMQHKTGYHVNKVCDDFNAAEKEYLNSQKGPQHHPV